MSKPQPIPVTISIMQGINLGITFSVGVLLFCVAVVPIGFAVLYAFGSSFGQTLTRVLTP